MENFLNKSENNARGAFWLVRNTTGTDKGK